MHVLHLKLHSQSMLFDYQVILLKYMYKKKEIFIQDQSVQISPRCTVHNCRSRLQRVDTIGWTSHNPPGKINTISSSRKSTQANVEEPEKFITYNVLGFTFLFITALLLLLISECLYRLC